MEYDAALGEAHGRRHSPYQLKMLAYTFTANVLSGYMLTAFPLMSQPPTFRCVSKDSDEMELCDSVCYRYPESWSFDHENGVSLISHFSLICQKQYLVTYISSYLMLGGMLGTITMSYVIDSLGRKTTNLLALIILMLGSNLLLISSTHDWVHFYFFLCGFGAGPLSVISKVFLVEVIGHKRTMYFQISAGGFALGRGCVVLVWLASGHWRFVIFFIFAVSIVLLWVILGLYESPRFLILGKQDVKQGSIILNAIRRFNGLPEEKELVVIASNKEKEKPTPPSKPSLRSHAKLITIQAMHFFICGGSYFIIVFNLRYFEGSIYAVGLLLATMEGISYVLVSYISDKFGRLKVYYLHFPLAGLASFLLLVTDVPVFTFILTLIAAYANAATQAMPSMLNAELFPANVIGKVTSITTFFLRLGGVCAPWMVEISRTNSLNPMSLVTIMSIIGFSIVPILPETLVKKS